MLASGLGIADGASLPAMAMEDIAASILARFGEDVSELDGQPRALAGRCTRDGLRVGLLSLRVRNHRDTEAQR